jgi:hypothetical protein
MRPPAILSLVALISVGAATVESAPASDPIALYDFKSSGNVIFDRSPIGKPVHLHVTTPGAVRRTPGALEVRSTAQITSAQAANKISFAIQKSGEFTLEAWLKPSNTTQRGPARIISLSLDSADRNFTLAQERDRFEFRLRTTATDDNGLPALVTPAGKVKTELTHFVYTRDSSGTARIYLNSGQIIEKKITGSTTKWNETFRLMLANEGTRDRPWRGTFHLLAIYDRALSRDAVARYFRAGLKGRNQVLTAEVVPTAETAPVASPALFERIDPPVGDPVREVDFERHVVPLFSRQGCNAGSCHGSFSGASDFRLSLFGHNPKMDYLEIVDPDEGPRAEVDDVDRSVLLRKPSGQRRHRGGVRFEPDSWQYQIFRNWIAGGAKWTAGSGALQTIRIVPDAHRFSDTNETVQLKVMAQFTDGTGEDITAFCKFDTQDDYVAEVSDLGLLRSVRPGDTAVIISYRDRTASTRAYVPVPVYEGFTYPRISAVNYIDTRVLSKLRKLNIVPSFHTTDGEFLRRVYIDTIGRLPNSEEIRRFFLDQSEDKRDRTIDMLLEHRDHAALWATKLSDITGNDTIRLYSPAEKRSQMWHDWLRVRFERNEPYSEIVRGILTASSREGRSEKEWFGSALKNDESNVRGFESAYAERDTLDLFWKRRNLKAEQVGERVAAAFLGVRLQCAQCHKHPYDRWTQVDYRGFAGLFGQVKVHNGGSKGDLANENKRRKRIKDKKKRVPQLREVYVDPKNPKLMPHPETKKGVPAAPLASEPLSGKGDYRRKLWEWMTDRENRLFAHNFVNRIWKHYFGIGIVEPVDDLSDANPPTHPHLLDSLARDFIASNFDIRHIERRILRSRVYQFSSLPNRTNSEDRKNFARSYPRNLMAEVAVDVINSAVGVQETYRSDVAPGRRAIDVAASTVRDGDLRHAFSIFGRPTRAPVCECERTSDPALTQTLHLMSDADLMNKIRNGRLKQHLSRTELELLKKGEMPDSQIAFIIRDLFLATLVRHPDKREMRAAMASVKRHRDETGFTDVMWALMNTREFILNH